MTTVLRPYTPSIVSAPLPTTTHYMGIHAHDNNPPPRFAFLFFCSLYITIGTSLITLSVFCRFGIISMLTWTTHFCFLVIMYAPRTTHRSTRYTPRYTPVIPSVLTSVIPTGRPVIPPSYHYVIISMLTWTTQFSSLVLLYAPRTTHRSTRYTLRSNLRYTHRPTRYTTPP